MKKFALLLCLIAILAGCTTTKVFVVDMPEAPPVVKEDLIIVPTDKAIADPEHNLLWFDARDLTIEGKGWDDTETFYERLPERAKPKATKNVRTLAAHTAGICVRFVTDAKKLKADWTTGGFDMKHMAWTGIRGLDLYQRTDDGWEYAGTGKPGSSKDNRTTATIGTWFPELSGVPTEFLLYLPLYDSVKELKIGIPDDAFMALPPQRPDDRRKPIIFYGTSMTQGGCASRTGMCHVAILGRWLDREVINWGFSGSGQMEPIMAELLAELDAALYILECLPNMTHEMVKERIEPFLDILRAAHPDTPILLVQSPLGHAGNPDVKAIYERRRAAGDENIYLLPGVGQLDGIENGTVDGVHPTDLGFRRMSEFYYPVLVEMLNN